MSLQHMSAEVTVCAVVAAVGASGCGGGADDADGGGADATATCASDEACDDGDFCNGRELCRPMDPGAAPDGCVVGERPCSPEQGCDDERDRCVTDCPDADGDGHAAASCGGDDCDDSASTRFPGNTEVCEPGVDTDEDCDPTTYGDRDEDGDGYVSDQCCNDPAGAEPACGTDCDDANASVHPTEAELCNEIDDDCDGSTDEGTQVLLYEDADGDGHGDPDGDTMMGCADGDYEGWAVSDDDCLDQDADIVPGQTDFFGEPYCAGAEDCGEPTDFGTGVWRCESPTCFVSWDYNCDGAETLQPDAGPCVGTCMSGLSCGATGIRHDSDVECGELVYRTACRCMAGDLCDMQTVEADVSMPCH